MKVKIGDLTQIRTGKLDANASSEDGKYPFFTCSREPLKISSYSYDCECVLVAGNGDLNVKYYKGKFDAYQRTYIIEDNSDGKLYMPYLYYFMEGYIEELRKQAIGGVIKYIKLGNLTDAFIELPSVDKQKEIVDILDKSKKIIDLQNDEIMKLDQLIKARFVDMFGNIILNEKCWKTDKWSNVLKIVNGKNQKAVESDDGEYLICGSGGAMGRATEYLTDEDSVIIGRKGSINKPLLMREKYWNVDTAFGIEPNRKYINVDYLYMFCIFFNFEKLNKAVTIPSLTKADLLKIEMPIPDILLQEQFADFVHQVDKSKVAVQQALTEAQLLFDSLMQKYFG